MSFNSKKVSDLYRAIKKSLTYSFALPRHSFPEVHFNRGMFSHTKKLLFPSFTLFYLFKVCHTQCQYPNSAYSDCQQGISSLHKISGQIVLQIKLGLSHNLLSLLIAVSLTTLVESDFYTFWTPLALAVAAGSP